MPALLLIAGIVLFLYATGGAKTAAKAVRRAVRAIEGAKRFPPSSPEAIALFQQAAAQAGLPLDWAADPGLHSILQKESDGYVGIPNYTWGEASVFNATSWPAIWAQIRAGQHPTTSTATGLGQLIVANVDKYYPSKRAGIGNALEEAVGMLRYIKDRYGTPANAWARYGKGQEGY